MGDFSASSRNIVLHGSFLYAECATIDGEWQRSILDLDRYLGNDSGKFSWDSGYFSVTAQDIRIEGSVLYARLQHRDRYLRGSVDLDECIANEDGHLKYSQEENIGFSETSREVVLDRSILRAECFTPDGQWMQSSMDLDHYIGNNCGEFEWGGTQFSSAAKDIRLDCNILYAHLKIGPDPDDYSEAWVDLDDGIINDYGRLKCSVATQKFGDEPGMLCQSDNFPPDLLNEEDRQVRDADEADAQEARSIIHAAAASDLPPYEHSPLANTTAIRLVKIKPAGEEPDVIECSLIEVEQPGSRKFNALSYTWGSPFPSTIPSVEEFYQQTATILCNGRPFQVKQNLYEALRRLRRKTTIGETRGPWDETELIRRAWTGSLVKVENLLRQGADVNACDNSGRTALHCAAGMGHLDIVKALVVAGSNLNATCDAGKTPLAYAREVGGPDGRSVTGFLVQQQDARYTVTGTNTSLRSNATGHNYFWIDAICINQADNEEKASQVGMMGHIYRSAECVVVWLGREYHNFQDTTEDLLQGVWRLELARKAGSIPSDTIEQMVNDPVKAIGEPQSLRARLAAIDWLNTLGRMKIEKWLMGPPIFHRTWFERAWILQEVFMAKDLTVLCGPYLLPWDVFIFMSSAIQCCRLLLNQNSLSVFFGTHSETIGTVLVRGAMSLSSIRKQNEVPSVSLERRRLAFGRGGELPMLASLSLSRNQNATDARDKVFSVLSFSPIKHITEEGPRSIIPDYTRSTRWLYIEVGRSLLAAYGPCALSWRGAGSLPQTEGLPSWVPDLNSPLHARSKGIDLTELRTIPLYHQSTEVESQIGSIQTSQLQITSQNELLLKGYVWDTVSEVAHTGLNDVGIDLTGLSRWLELLSKLDVPLEQRRRILWRTLTEDTAQDEPAVDNERDVAFMDWLKFLCFCSMLGHEESFRASVLSAVEPDIYYHEKIQRPQSQILAVLEEAQNSFTALGIPLPDDTVKQWSNPYTYSSAYHERFVQYYSDLIHAATNYSHVIRNTDPSRRLLRTAMSSTLGTGPQAAQAGDAICVIDGATVPYVLRLVSEGKYRLIGEAYAYHVDVKQLLSEAEALGKIGSICII